MIHFMLLFLQTVAEYDLEYDIEALDTMGGEVKVKSLSKEMRYRIAFELHTNPKYGFGKSIACKKAGIHHTTYDS
jgi:hypothetical protein